ncbi:HlyD family type I secretion periplasmic adaptor subunit [Mesorhizobium sp. NBSH29]|nr:HlyD family type I secretion periplasmic adaptor subunit [Mesorhizobium sp. NBSH29]
MVSSSAKRPRLAGYLAIIGFVAGFGYWAATVPLSGAALAPGIIAAAGRNVQVQHLEGGIVAEIHVTEGSRVSSGQSMLVLDPTQAKTQLNRLLQKWVSFQAMIARLVAERDALDTLPQIPASPFAFEIDGAILEDQRKEFFARLERYQAERAILNLRVTTLEEARRGLDAQQVSVEEQLAIVADELARKKSLVEKGLTNRFEYTQMLRNQADLIGQKGITASEIASSDTQRLEAVEQLARLATKRVEDAVSRLNEIRASLVDVEEQMFAAHDILQRTVVRAPVDGIVVTSLYNSVGSVIAPAEKVIELLPTTRKLIIDARLRPQDVDSVKVGQSARLRLSALNMRLTPEISGEVALVSADRLVDEVTQEPYYQARVEIADQLPPPVTKDRLYPGMPVEAFINTGERTFFAYLARPILDSFNRAFIEE